MTLPVHMLGIAGLTMTAPLVAVVNSGTFPRSAVLLWILNFLYFFTTTFYIRLRIRLQFKASAGIKLWGKLKLGLPAITSSVVPVVIMIILTKTVFVIPFIPGIMKAIGGSILYQPEKKTKPIVLGITEIIFTLLFVVLTVWVWNI